ncbi:hypothetical protein HMPREF9443_00179 [Phascolarctobacterium succinatutens YIT 12067]|jgi:hypothetical protein|uniref:Uncharacterized protein n=1 Tax=Phascolarctobacterium succinatutens YIT 12067 TaxID=626939 RepID=E8LBG8_9FIRM|nr:hypothetical protein HMPREF9443_00179 [Phascolarctobacterium succinatutens YIT 12067]
MYREKSKADGKIAENNKKFAYSYPKNAFRVGANCRVYLIIKLPKIQ